MAAQSHKPGIRQVAAGVRENRVSFRASNRIAFGTVIHENEPAKQPNVSDWCF
jgi:hypothetical protein